MLARLKFTLIAGFACAAGAQEQAKPQLTARELFYSAVQTPARPAAAAKQKARPAAPAAPPKKAILEPVPTAAKNTAPQAPTSAAVPAEEGARIVPAVNTVSAPAGPPLGLKYSILKKTGDQMVEVPADSVFHAGDRIQLRVETNGPGYLYIVSQGSSGTWRPMFPSAEVEEGNNRVEGFHPYLMPPKSNILFDEQTGNEKLFVVFSREPEVNLEKMIYSLKGGAAPRPAAAPSPGETVQPNPAPPKTMVVMADARIDDNTVGRLRNAYARDLVIEKVDQATAGERKETAVYVVNPSGGSSSRVVADLQLVHR